MTQDSTAEFGPEEARTLHQILVEAKPNVNGLVSIIFHKSDIPRMVAALSLTSGAETAAARDVLAERRRQIEAEGWTPEHDDTHGKCELAQAAACYAVARSPYQEEREWVYPAPPKAWPWQRGWWKPGDYRRNLVKAAALLLAEIERWDRLHTPPADLASRSASPGDGWKLVPVEPTPDMCIQGGIAWADALPKAETYVDTADACYKAMLAASPTPPAPHVEDREKVEPFSEGDYRPCVVRYDEAGFSEFIIADVAHVVRQGERFDTLLHLKTREVVGFRWRSPKPPADDTERAKRIAKSVAGDFHAWLNDDDGRITDDAAIAAIAPALHAVRQEERERCAKVAESVCAEHQESGARVGNVNSPFSGALAHSNFGSAATARKIAAAIRAGHPAGK